MRDMSQHIQIRLGMEEQGGLCQAEMFNSIEGFALFCFALNLLT